MGIDDTRRAFAVRLNEALDDIQFPAKGRGRQQALADRMQVSQKGARKWLEGEAMPEQFRIVELAQWLNVRFEWLATGQGERRHFGPDELQVPASHTREVQLGGEFEELPAPELEHVDLKFVRDRALSKIREQIDGQHRAARITDDDATLLYAALRAVRAKMEPSIKAAVLLILGSQAVPEGEEELAAQPNSGEASIASRISGEELPEASATGVPKRKRAGVRSTARTTGRKPNER